jgi:hypothetical protein
MITDPGTTTCFAGLIGCINPYTRKIYILDEIYEKDQSMTSTRMIYPRLEKLAKIWYPGSSIQDDWMKVTDEAAAWFANEAMQQYNVYFTPTAKHIHKKEAGLSLIKDVLIHDFLCISDKCENLFKEMQEYAKDDKGNIPKKNDHLIDCLRYLLGAANYNMHEAFEQVSLPDPEKELWKDVRKYNYVDDNDNEDWTDVIDFEFF